MSSDEAEFESENEEEEEEYIGKDNEPVSKPGKRKASSRLINYAENDDEEEEEDEDDIPLAKLMSSKKKAKSVSEPKTKVSSSAKKAAPASKQSKTKVSAQTTAKVTSTKQPVAENASEVVAAEDYRSISAAVFGSECTKGQLIQKLLCRWWYAIEWPTNIPSKAPHMYDAMDGMPGVYVCVEGDDVGKIKDLRDMKNKPSFSNFLSKGSEELKDLLVLAIERQLTALIQSEGEGTITEKELKEMLKWANKVNTDKADKEVERMLKKAGMSLEQL